MYFARAQRGNPTQAEESVWKLLRKKQTGHLFKRQVPVGKYVLDFYCPQASLAVEVDGGHHANQLEYDAERDKWLKERGIGILRIPADDLYYDPIGLPKWIRCIKDECDLRARILHPNPSSSTRVDEEGL
jgi:very-short-patch-repair endonuclease